MRRQGSGASLVLIWLNEVLDLPALLLGAPETPVNWRESLLESAFMRFGLGCSQPQDKNALSAHEIFGRTAPCLRRLQADPLPRRRLAADRDILETYIAARSDAEFTHGICPDCAERLYPGFNPYKQNVVA